MEENKKSLVKNNETNINQAQFYTQEEFSESQENEDIVAKVALENFDIKYLFPWQRLVIANILDAANSQEDRKTLGKQIVLLPTGAGKSLCFQIPALLLGGPTLIIYPLLALMSDQERRMTDGALECVVFRGGQTEENRNENFKKLKNGAKIIIANPEVLCSKKLVEQLKECKIAHVAIDEAHCVSEWGDSFRPSYLELGHILKDLNVPLVTAFTATASPQVLSRIGEVLFEGEAHIVRSESDRQNIHYYVKKVAAKKQAALILAGSEQKPMIIFCGTRKKTEDMAKDLNLVYGKEFAKFYHAGLERKEKDYIEKWFFEKKDAVLCATCAYGMGVDKKDIHTVVHLEPPATAEAYIQEAGRGGRDGSVANAILLWNQEDSEKIASIEKTSNVEKSRLLVMKNFALATTCRRQILLDALGAEQAVCSGCDICDSKNIDSKNTNTHTNKKNAHCEFQNWKKNFPVFQYISEVKNSARAAKNVENKRMVADAVVNDSLITEKIIQICNKYFDTQKLEEKVLEILNKISRPITKVNIWNHQAFSEIFKQLILQKKIKICKWPWSGKIEFFEPQKERKKRFKRYVKITIKKKFLHFRKNFLQYFQHFHSS